MCSTIFVIMISFGMNKRVISVLSLALLASSCADKVSVLTPAQRKARIDSLVKQREEELKSFEQERLLDRRSIEVKEKTDSILAERFSNRPVPAPVILQDSLLQQPDTALIPDTTQL